MPDTAAPLPIKADTHKILTTRSDRTADCSCFRRHDPVDDLYAAALAFTRLMHARECDAARDAATVTSAIVDSGQSTTRALAAISLNVAASGGQTIIDTEFDDALAAFIALADKHAIRDMKKSFLTRIRGAFYHFQGDCQTLFDRAYAENRAMRSERDATIAEVITLRARLAEIECIIDQRDPKAYNSVPTASSE